ncbi:ABC transporter substrate-binding protein [Paenibacillus sp. MBLB4367]|uniref:ABC transporter substrate-binding protein n=1 Tax=Paenibacillus sp. MBLB4367 TaxID=3384767 RepID=UPI003908436E
MLKGVKKAGAITMAAVLGTTIALTGCSGGDTKKADEGKPKSEQGGTKEQRKVVLSTIKNYYTTALKQIAKDYTALHPETTVEIEIIADNATYAQNFTTKMSADKKTAPDIVHTNLLGVADEGALIPKGWLAGLDDLLNESNPYNGGKKVRDAIDSKYLALAVGSSGKTPYLPFDLVGLGVYYNKTIFNKVGVKPPATIEEFVEVSGKLKAAGYNAPIGASSFNGWLVLSLADWAYRKDADKMLTLPGDGRFDEQTMAKNKDVKYSADNAMFDETAIFDPEKIIALSKTVPMNSPVNEKIWSTYKSLAQFFPKGWSTPDDGQTYSQFMAQNVPMFIFGSWQVGTILGDMQKLAKDKTFEWGTFKFPKFAKEDPNFPGEPRSLLVAGHKLGLSQKDDPEQYKRASDFLKYVYSPEIAAKIYDITIKSGEYVQGPSLITGVKLSDEINSYLDGFKAKGNMRTEYSDLAGAAKLEADKPLASDQEVKYVEGKLDWSEFAKGLEKFTGNVMNDRVKKFGYDLNPKTAEKEPAK